MGAAIDDLVIICNGNNVAGWLSARVVRGIERLPSALALEFSEKYPTATLSAVIPPGSSVQVYLGPDLILTGYANLYAPHVDGDRHVVRVEARSKTQDLVDCSLAPPAALPPWQIVAATLGQAATSICKFFEITVAGDGVAASLVTTPSGGIIPPFPINYGETPYQLIEYMARTVGVLVFDDAQGRLVLSKVGTTRAGSPLVEGINAEIEEARLSDDQRYSQIVVIGQAALPPLFVGDTFHLNAESTAPHGVDPGVKRYRPKLVIMDLPGPANAWADQRADWEVRRRVARSQIVDVTVTGWRDGAGALWQPNTLVKCALPSVKISGDLLIAECSWQRSEIGTSTTLTLMPPEGFVPEPFNFDPLPGYQDNASTVAGSANTDPGM